MTDKANFGLNSATLIGILITLVIILIIANQAQENSKQLSTTAQKLNSSYDQIIKAQQDANDRGNITINYFEQLFNKILDTEQNIIGNLSSHRIIANISRDTQIDLLEQILNQTR